MSLSRYSDSPQSLSAGGNKVFIWATSLRFRQTYFCCCVPPATVSFFCFVELVFDVVFFFFAVFRFLLRFFLIPFLQDVFSPFAVCCHEGQREKRASRFHGRSTRVCNGAEKTSMPMDS